MLQFIFHSDIVSCIIDIFKHMWINIKILPPNTSTIYAEADIPITHYFIDEGQQNTHAPKTIYREGATDPTHYYMYERLYPTTRYYINERRF